MRWATYVSPADGRERVGVVRDGLVHGLREPVRLLDLLGDDGERLATAAQQAVNDPAEVVAQAEVRLRAPIPLPPSIRDSWPLRPMSARPARRTARR